MRPTKNAAIVLCVCICMMLPSGVAVSRAEVRLPAIFNDNMVLQRDRRLTFWGWADPGQAVTVEVGRSRAKATADKQGKWDLQIGPLETGGPIEVTVKGGNTVTLKNVLVGDVWIGSGQSNMYWPVRNSANAQQEIAAADYPAIRLFDVAKNVTLKPAGDVHGRWRVCSPRTAGNFSAVAYYFGRKLHKELNVPIGLIHSSWAGTPIHSWIRMAGMARDADLKKFSEAIMKRTRGDYENLRREFEPQWARWQKAAEAARARGERSPGPRPAISFRHRAKYMPSGLYNGMIAPLRPLGIRGVIWYQGENDVGRGAKYARLFPALIRDWRRQWKQKDLPLLFVQLANYQARKAEPSDSQWARLREAQAQTLAVPGTGMACTIDIGEAEKIHPKNKQEVGRRLALAALHVAYGRKLVYSGPMLAGVRTGGNKATLTFNHVGGGLTVKGGEQLKGFAVAGADRKFVWATAQVKGDKVVVSSDRVGRIEAVRYAWADNPQCNLYNAEGLPAVPFRTDDW